MTPEEIKTLIEQEAEKWAEEFICRCFQLNRTAGIKAWTNLVDELVAKLEEEKRKAFEAGRQRVYNSWDFDLKRSPNEYDNKYSTYDDYLKSTPSTEGK
jgi:hypothetical protein